MLDAYRTWRLLKNQLKNGDANVSENIRNAAQIGIIAFELCCALMRSIQTTNKIGRLGQRQCDSWRYFISVLITPIAKISNWCVAVGNRERFSNLDTRRNYFFSPTMPRRIQCTLFTIAKDIFQLKGDSYSTIQRLLASISECIVAV